MTDKGTWIVRYAEIGLKGANRHLFERALVEHMRRQLKSCGAPEVTKTRGRVWVADDPEHRDRVRRALSLVPGIQSFSLARICDKDLDLLKACALDVFRESWSGDRPVVFRVTAKRSDKTYPLRSDQLGAELGAHLLENLPDGLLSVSMKQFELNLGVEIMENSACVYLRRERGVGGLPVGTAGEVMCLLSGGIDSPVAAWQMIRRGCRVHHVFFENRVFLGRAAFDKVERLAGRLAQLQGRSTLTVVPFSDIQVAIRDHGRPRLRVVLYRRFMYRIAAEIARQKRCLGLVTGENLGQVASQTLENIRAVNGTVDTCVYRPLLCLDKNDIIRIAKELGTFETSIEEAPDCCSVFLPPRPATRARVVDLEADESRLDVAALEQAAIQAAEHMTVS
jgi:thiamine biosynthesis protein ThiI